MMDWMLFVRIGVFIIGLAIVWHTLSSAVVTFVLPRSTAHWISSSLFRVIRRIFDFRMRWVHTYLERDRIMAFFAPVALLFLVPVWMTLVLIGYACMYWATGMNVVERDFLVSGSSLLTPSPSE